MSTERAQLNNRGDGQAALENPCRPIDSTSIAVIVVRDGRLPDGADEAALHAEGSVLLVGSGPRDAVSRLSNASKVWLHSSPTSPVALCSVVAPLVSGASLVVVPASADGRDLSPILSHRLGWPLLAGSVAASYHVDDATVRADLLRADGRVVVPAVAPAPAVVTIWPAGRTAKPHHNARRPEVHDLDSDPVMCGEYTTPGTADDFTVLDLETLAVLAPEPSTMDLADAQRVVAGGAGLVPRGAGDPEARAVFELLRTVASALGAAAGVTRVISDAGWAGHDRQIGTTGVSVDPDLYVAFGISGATQHVGGIGDAEHIVSINVDPSAPMARMANLAIIADAPGVLAEVAQRLDVAVPSRLKGAL